MEPFTAAMNLVAKIIEHHGRLFDALPPEQKAIYATAHMQADLDRLQRWLEFAENVRTIFKPPA